LSLSRLIDTETWATYRGLNLAGSLNPAKRPPLHSDILQIHYTGGSDVIVPPAITTQGVTGERTELIVIKGYDHVCCWENLWPSVLARSMEASIKKPDIKGRRADRPRHHN
jgi:hypothetical protein